MRSRVHRITHNIVVLCVAFGFYACSVPLPVLTKKPVAIKILEYTLICTRTGCPEFQLELYSNGKVIYTGKGFVPQMGTYTRMLTKSEDSLLTNTLNMARLWEVPERLQVNSFTEPIPQISVFEQEVTKKISGQVLPPNVQSLVGLLDQIIETPGWVQTAKPDYGLPEGTSPNVLRIQLQPGVPPEYWQGKYIEYGMAVVTIAQHAPNAWLFRFDPSRIPPLTMQALLKTDPDIIQFDFEKLPQK